ncbi:60S ribosomal protein L4 [Hondaea fermentalgiana]|uniref:60S ribosomal protein L4 n=1 Tax=Hondaea fermentalgiana TaxID=2315210 RepID=A0A2R5GVT8_9STRA|nr:60S ribosomal protein L4 [Hondaea fermentalgiana]|eukprot:GBG34685.1 60S ribosomal protein L4 [Hondaea fermentalgiana]
MTDAAARPTVSVFDAGEGESKVLGNVALPAVLTAPIRTDVVHFVHTNVAKNKRQAFCVKTDAGMDYAAESWGTGRAVSRIPRVPGGGTHRSGQGAFGNMCRGGRMFNPTRIWRKWHRRVNKNQRRYATASALAASAVPALVMARGHAITEVPEMPLVIGGGQLDEIKKTKQAVELLDLFGASADVDRVKSSKKIRAGKGKMRNRRYVMRRGPLIVHACNSPDMPRAFRNVPGVQLCHVDRLNILQLAPGGHVGRFVIWTQDAFEKLDTIFGTLTEKSTEKKGFSLPRAVISNADVDRIISSEEIQKVIRPVRTNLVKRSARKKNPLRNLGAMIELNPYKQAHRRAELAAAKQRSERKEKIKTKRETNTKEQRKAFYAKMLE